MTRAFGLRRRQRPGDALDRAPGDGGFLQLHALGQRIAPAQMTDQRVGEAHDGRALAAQARVAQRPRQLARTLHQHVGLVEQAIEHAAQRRRAFRFGQRLDANPLGREMIERHIDPVHLQIVVLAILQVIDDLQRIAQGVRVVLARRILAMHVEQVAPDRRGGIAAIVHQVGPVVVAQLGRIRSGTRSAGRCNRPRAHGSPSGSRASRRRPARRAAPDP